MKGTNDMIHGMDFETMSSYDGNGKLYFTVTVRCEKNKKLWGLVRNGEMNLSAYGKIAQSGIAMLNDFNPAMQVEKSVVMPNHIHMLISMRKSELSYTPRDEEVKIFFESVIEEYKEKIKADILDFISNGASRGIPMERDTDFWHSGCHVRGVHNLNDYIKAVNNIKTNVKNWESDRYYSE